MMSNENDINLQETIEPIEIATTDSAKAQPVELIVPEGHVLLMGIDAEGNEVQGSEFFYPEKSYKRFYGDETKYIVKKKAQ